MWPAGRVFETTVLSSIEARRDLFLSLCGPRAHFFVKMWPSNEFEFETPCLKLDHNLIQICFDFEQEEVHSVVGDVVKQFMFATTGNASDSPETKSQFLRSITTSQNHRQVTISITFYEHLLHPQIPKAQRDIDDLTEF